MSLANTPELWRSTLPQRRATDNKYDRGYAVIFAAPHLLGATRLAATAADRVGTGLVGVVARGRASWSLRASLPPDILVLDELPAKRTAVLGGSGGIDAQHRNALLGERGSRVLDADMLNARLPLDTLDATSILTPHTGEFLRMFPDLDATEDGARNAAQSSGVTLVLKGPVTWIAHPDGRVAENASPNPDLAKAGTGDVLAGAIAGLLAQGMPSWEAACAGVWLHSRAAEIAGPFLNASGLVQTLRLARAELQ